MLFKNKLLLCGYILCSVISISLYGSDKKTSIEIKTTSENSKKDVKSQTESLKTASLLGPSITFAIRAGNIKEVTGYFKQNPDKLNSRDKEGKTALEIAAGAIELQKDQLPLVEAILQFKPDFGQALLEAVESDNPKMVKLLLDFGAPINTIDEEGRNALMLAKSYQVAKLFLEKKFDLTTQDAEGQTAYQIAFMTSKDMEKSAQEQKEYASISELIKEKASSQNIPFKKLLGVIKAPIDIVDAIKNKSIISLDQVKKYLDTYENFTVNALDDEGNPIIISAITHQPQIAHELIKRGANLNVATKTGWTPLMFAAFTGNRELIISMMFDLSMENIKQTNNDGETASDIAQDEYEKTQNPIFVEIINALYSAEKHWQPLKK